MLTLPEGIKGFVVYYDASRMLLGCGLTQHWKVIAYDSRELKVHDNNYPTYDLELAFVVFALKILRLYLYGLHVDVYTNQKYLQYVFTLKESNLKQLRWSELLKECDMTVLYTHNKDNVVVDALSHVTKDSVSHIEENNKDFVKDVHMFDRLVVRLEGSLNGRFMVHHYSE